MIQDFFAATKSIIATFDDFAQKYSLAGKAEADHICYKCGSKERFEEIRTMFEAQSSYVYQSIISERRIAIIRFKSTLETTLGPISLLELSDQKPDGSQKDSWDHIEIYPIGISTTELVQFLQNQNVMVETVVRPHHTTHDIVLDGGFKVRIEDEPLVAKIKREEMK